MLPSFSFTEGLLGNDVPLPVWSLSTNFFAKPRSSGEIEGEIAEGAILKVLTGGKLEGEVRMNSGWNGAFSCLGWMGGRLMVIQDLQMKTRGSLQALNIWSPSPIQQRHSREPLDLRRAGMWRLHFQSMFGSRIFCRYHVRQIKLDLQVDNNYGRPEGFSIKNHYVHIKLGFLSPSMRWSSSSIMKRDRWLGPRMS